MTPAVVMAGLVPAIHLFVMAGLVPAIHALPVARKTWMPATKARA
jgi:hypothetical protein